ncbi:GNAT family N-acetyltransferase [Lacibacterium aquatile]|uniref:GNAT family N-acetyltransferase n=1 Tax=Lacibacterium aquatile TaxID=1168082 RepID=A0ABW5DMA8_9PROT
MTGLERLLAPHPVFRLYFHAAVAAGERNRSAYLSDDGTGAALAISFAKQGIRTLIGELPDDIIRALANLPTVGELHLEARHLEAAKSVLSGRIKNTRGLRYYARPTERMEVDPRCRRLTPADHALVSHFFDSFYPAAIFSPWMLEGPFIGLFKDGQLLACGGVVAQAKGAANIGNFLTHPAHRGRFLGKTVLSCLINTLAEDGIGEVTLGTNQDNLSACLLYEAFGFQMVEERLQLDLGGPRV